MIGVALGCTLVSAGRASAGTKINVGAVGILWSSDRAAPAAPPAVVIAIHDSSGIDHRGWRYGDQITAAGIPVLHVEMQSISADGASPAVALDETAAAIDRLTTIIDLLAEDPHFADAAVGLLAFGSAGRVAALVAASSTHGQRVAALALLYPGCGDLAASLAATSARLLMPILLLHGDADPTNPPADCIGATAHLARTAPVRRRQYEGAGYAWDLPPLGPHEALKLPWPGRPGFLVSVGYWHEAAELSSAHAASFFAATLAVQRP
ncbi:dienelactone hydrolase family protein [Falsiroseomonas sp. E2-1-a20]|uniref:dienelactone hydrolase family protein n=1 Tax=Falsiroseomonas sp. E2-1-a20 TaxID=3239300 RepID=UPI003F2DEC25